MTDELETIELFPAVQFRKNHNRTKGWQWEFQADGQWLVARHCYGDDVMLDHVAQVTRERNQFAKENAKLRGPEETVTSARGDRLFTFMSKDPCRYRLCEVTYAAPVRVLRAERDQLKAEVEALRKDGERYRWLRDSSEPIHQFYLSTPIWFAGVKFRKENVDSTIDAAMGAGAQP